MTEAPMIDDRQFREVLRMGFAQQGLDGPGTDRLVQFIDAVTEVRSAGALARKVFPLRKTVFGEALYREWVGDDGETAVAAAARLHVNVRVLRREQARIRRLLTNPVTPADTVATT